MVDLVAVVFLASLLGPLAVLAAVAWHYRKPVPLARAAPDFAGWRAWMSARLRFEAVEVHESADGPDVRTSPFTVARIRAPTPDTGGAPTIAHALTRIGWAVALALNFGFLLPFVAPLFAFAALRHSKRAAAWTVGRLAAEAPVAAGFDADEVGRSLVEALAGARSIAERALQHEENSLATMQVSGALLFALFGLLLSALLAGAFGVFAPEATSWITLLGMVEGLYLVWFVWSLRRLGPALKELREWTGRLRTAEWSELHGPPGADGATSTFELLAQASEQVPSWLRVARGVLDTKPGTWQDRVARAGAARREEAVRRAVERKKRRGDPSPALTTREQRALAFIDKLPGAPNTVRVKLPLWMWAVAFAALYVIQTAAAALGAVSLWSFSASWVAFLVILSLLQARQRAKTLAHVATEQEGWQSRFSTLRAKMETFVEGL